MCGRYTLIQPKKVIRELHGDADPDGWSQRFNIAPSHSAPVITSGNASSQNLLTMSWGFARLAPARPVRSLGQIINVRIETVNENVRFRDSFRLRRCVVLADGFYEWRRMQRQNQPYLFRLENGVPFGFAGIWESADDVDSNEIQKFVILTTTANRLVGELHDRMPVILDEKMREEWLGYDTTAEVLQGMSEPFAASAMERFPVSHYVNNPVNEGPYCVKRTLEPEVDTLFS